MSVCKRIDCTTTLEVDYNEGYCYKHYKLWLSNGVPYRTCELYGPERPPKICARLDCETALSPNVRTSKYCRRHAALLARNGVPYREDELYGPERPCNGGEACERPVLSKGKCRVHYNRARRSQSDPDVAPLPDSDIDSALKRLKSHAQDIGIRGAEDWWIESPEPHLGIERHRRYALHMLHPTHCDDYGNPKPMVLMLAKSHRDSVNALHAAEAFLLMNPAWSEFAETYELARTKSARARELAEGDRARKYVRGNEVEDYTEEMAS